MLCFAESTRSRTERYFKPVSSCAEAVPKMCKLELGETDSDRKPCAGLQGHPYLHIWIFPLWIMLMAETRMTGHRHYDHGYEHVHVGFSPATHPFFSCHSVHELSKPGQHICWTAQTHVHDVWEHVGLDSMLHCISWYSHKHGRHGAKGCGAEMCEGRRGVGLLFQPLLAPLIGCKVYLRQ